jgi:hypothetical protein
MYPRDKRYPKKIFVDVQITPQEMNTQSPDHFLVYEVPKEDRENIEDITVIGHVTNLPSGNSTKITLYLRSNLLNRYGVTESEFSEYISNPILHLEGIKEKFRCGIIKYLIFNKKWNEYDDTIFNRLDMWESAMSELDTFKPRMIHSLAGIIGGDAIRYLPRKLNEYQEYTSEWKKFLFKDNDVSSLNHLFSAFTNNYNANEFSQDIIRPLAPSSFHIGYLYGISKITLMGALSHESGHHIMNISELRTYFENFYPNNDSSNYFSGIKEKETYNEFLADIYSMMNLDAYLASNILTIDENFKIIKEWFRWNCTKNVANNILAGHPHNQFRHNTLLISKRVFDIVCNKFPMTRPTEKIEYLK